MATASESLSVTRRPSDEGGIQSQSRRQLCRLRSAAMDQYDANADLMQNTHLLHQRTRQRSVGEDFSADLEYEHLALEQSNIRRCMLQRRHDNRTVFTGSHEPLPSI